MPLLDTAYYGTDSCTNSVTVDKSVDFVENINGLSRFPFPRELSVTVSKEKTEYDYYGICPDTDPANANSFDPDAGATGFMVESVTQTRTEVVSDRIMCTHPGVTTGSSYFAPDGTKMLNYTGNMLWLGYEDVISVTFKVPGTAQAWPNDEFTTTGSRITSPFGLHPAVVAVGAATSTSSVANCLTDFAASRPVVYAAASATDYYVLRSANLSQSATDFHTMTIELYRFVPQTDGVVTGNADTSPLLSELTLVAAASTFDLLGSDYSFSTSPNDFPDFYSCTITVSLTSTGNPVRSETVEFYPSDTAQTAYMTTIIS